MSKLTTYKFCKLYKMSSGISSKPEQAGHGSPFLSFSAVFNNYFIPEQLNELMDTSEEEQEKYSILEGDIFLTRTSEVVDELGISSVSLKNYSNATYSGFLKRLRPLQTDVTYHKFMAFYLRSKLFRKTMTNNAVMTLRASLNENIFSYLDLILPEHKEQVKIGNLLYLISQKIELNNRINAELETMAKTLYDYWFVQFEFPDKNGKPYKSSGGKMVYNQTLKREIPEGWEVRELGEVLTIVRGASPRPIQDFLSNKGIPWVKISDATSSNSRFINETKQFIIEEGKAKTRYISSDTLILSNSATPGLPKIVKINAGVHDGWLIILEYTNGLTQEFIYHYFTYEYLRIVCLGNGSIFKNLKTDYVKSLKIILPPDYILNEASKELKNISELIYTKTKENQQLTQLRDWLLPMLMNGQITVK